MDQIQPAVGGKRLACHGFRILSQANNHSLDWGLKGMRERSRPLDEAGLVHAGLGEERGLARSPQFLEAFQGRVALVPIASTFRPTTEALPHEGAAPRRPGLNAVHVTRTVVVPDAPMKSLAQTDCVVHGHHCKGTSETLELFDVKYRLGTGFEYEYAMDPEDLAEFLRISVLHVKIQTLLLSRFILTSAARDATMRICRAARQTS